MPPQSPTLRSGPFSLPGMAYKSVAVYTKDLTRPYRYDSGNGSREDNSPLGPHIQSEGLYIAFALFYISTT